MIHWGVRGEGEGGKYAVASRVASNPQAGGTPRVKLTESENPPLWSPLERGTTKRERERAELANLFAPCQTIFQRSKFRRVGNRLESLSPGAFNRARRE